MTAAEWIEKYAPSEMNSDECVNLYFRFLDDYPDSHIGVKDFKSLVRGSRCSVSSEEHEFWED